MESYELTQEFRTKYVASAPADCLQTLTTAAASKNEQSQHSKYSTEHGMIIYLWIIYQQKNINDKSAKQSSIW